MNVCSVLLEVLCVLVCLPSWILATMSIFMVSCFTYFFFILFRFEAHFQCTEPSLAAVRTLFLCSFSTRGKFQRFLFDLQHIFILAENESVSFIALYIHHPDRDKSLGDVKPKEYGKRGSLLVISLTNCLDLPQAPCTGVEGLGGLRLAFAKIQTEWHSY